MLNDQFQIPTDAEQTAQPDGAELVGRQMDDDRLGLDEAKAELSDNILRNEFLEHGNLDLAQAVRIGDELEKQREAIHDGWDRAA